MAGGKLDAAARARPAGDARADWLIGGGEMGKYIRSTDWSQSPLGPIESWPPSLRTTVSLALSSNFPISLIWGPECTQIYNDGYWPLCGAKHPQSMGQDYRVCWESAWPVLVDPFDRAMRGETSYMENQRMFLHRHGYLEETFFTFSFSPIRDETGKVAGLFHPVTETTAQLLSERRTRVIRDLAARTGAASTAEESLLLAAQALGEAELDVPFMLLYRFDVEREQARLVSSCGLQADAAGAPATCSLAANAQRELWPLRAILESGFAQSIDLQSERYAALRAGPYPEPIKLALALPFTLPGEARPAGAVVAAVSSRLPLTDAYRAFYDLLAGGISAGFTRAHAYEQERQRAEALAEIDRAKTTFFSNVSHEFRTPLTLMLGPIEEELDERQDPLPPQRLLRLQTAHRNTLRLLKLVNTLLDFSRIEAGKVQAHFAPLDLAQLTAELASAFRSALDQAGLTLTVDCQTLPEPVYVDRDMWEKIVLNVMSNAFKHTFTGGIHVALRWAGENVELSIADTGVGIAQAEQAKLFERFHRVKGARSRTHEGTGIGLALVQELVAAHGGAVSVASEPGKGSTFLITVRTGRSHLPADRVAAAASDTTLTHQASAFVQEALQWLPDAPARNENTVAANEGTDLPEQSGKRRPRIVWADDNSDMREYVARLLSDQYDVQGVTDGESALRAAVEQPPDLVLSDVMMPGLDGFGLLRALRRNEKTKLVPVILLSARAGEESAVEGLVAGADDYLIKPFASRELLARVRTHIELAHLRRAWSHELEQANRELEAFTYSVSHDLRVPLRAIDGFSKALLTHQAERLDEQGKSQLARVRAAAGRMSQLIDDMLELSRVSRASLHRQRVDLTEVASAVAEELQRRSPERQLDFEAQPGLIVQADPRFILLVFENLLGNAWKFTSKQPKPQVRVGRAPPPARNTFFVRDNGAGFDMSYANKLFQPFSRLHPQSEFEGTGVGLATVQRVVARHGGRIWAEATPGEGATFYFTLESEH